MSVKVEYSNGVFKPLQQVRDTAPGKVYTVFSDEELRDLTENMRWLKGAEESFEFWNNQDDEVYNAL